MALLAEADLVPRIRTLKPEHKAHRKIGRLTHFEYRMWVGLVTEADDEGRLVADGRQLRALIFAYHPVRLVQMESCLRRLGSLGLIRLYSVNGTRYAYFPSWTDHQRIERPQPSRLPSPGGLTIAVPGEHAIHEELYGLLCRTKRFAEHELSIVERNVRIGSGVADLVLVSVSGLRLVVELKKTRIDSGAVKQVQRYQAQITDSRAVVIGKGVSPKFALGAARSGGVALIAYGDDGACSLVLPSDALRGPLGDLAVKPVVISHSIESDFAVAQDLDLDLDRKGSKIGSEGRGGQEGRGVSPHGESEPLETQRQRLRREKGYDRG